jgi:hypothetical protein
MSYRHFIIAVAILMGCGVASVSPIVTDADLVYEPSLVGTWQGAKESAVITAASANSYNVLFTDEDGKTGRFSGRLGRLGAYRVLDLQPDDPIPAASDVYKSLLLRAHGIVIVDSIGDVTQFRLVETDSLKAYLKKRPQAVPHTMVGDAVLLTASSVQARRFLTAFVRRRGVLDKPYVWRRSVP